MKQILFSTVALLAGGLTAQAAGKDVICTYSEKNGGTGSVAFDENMGATFAEVSGLRSAPRSVPGPASAALSLLALATLACRRRR